MCKLIYTYRVSLICLGHIKVVTKVQIDSKTHVKKICSTHAKQSLFIYLSTFLLTRKAVIVSVGNSKSTSKLTRLTGKQAGEQLPKQVPTPPCSQPCSHLCQGFWSGTTVQMVGCCVRHRVSGSNTMKHLDNWMTDGNFCRLVGKAKALNANSLLRSRQESGKDLHTFFPCTKYIFILKGCYVAIKFSDITGNQYTFLVLQKASISSHHPLSPVASTSHWLSCFLKHHLTRISSMVLCA